MMWELMKNNNFFWYLLVPLILVLCPMIKWDNCKVNKWLKKILGDSVYKSVISFFFMSVPIAIGGIQIFSNSNNNSTKDSIVLAIYYLAIEIIVVLVEKYNHLLPKTKDSYTFNKRYAGIQEQWDMIKVENKTNGPKGVFVDESLRALEDALTNHDFYYHSLSEKDRKIKQFATESGSLSKDYIILCSNENIFFNVIFASLYRYLFNEYKVKVLSSIKPTSIGGSDLIIPEFVSNELTQIIIKNSSNIDYQHNTSVSAINDFANNVKEGTELNGNKNNKTDFLQRIIITDDILAPNNIDPTVFQRIIDWHKDSNMDLKFISKAEAEEEQKIYPRVDRLDFSIVKMKSEKWFILGADRLTSKTLIAGNRHEMYSVRCVPKDEKPESSFLFDSLWKKAKKGSISNNVVLFS